MAAYDHTVDAKENRMPELVAAVAAAASLSPSPEVLDLPLQQRHDVRLRPASLVAETRTVEVVWSTGAAVRRSDPWTGKPYIERLSLEPGHVDLSRLANGAPLLDRHSIHRLVGIIGVAERAWIESGAAGPAAERAVTTGVRQTTVGLRAELRAQVTAAGLGPRLARAWPCRVYPQSGTSLTAAGVVWTKAPRIVAAFARTTTIRSKRGFYLAIPAAAAGRYGDGRRQIMPLGRQRRTGMRLRFVCRRNGPSLLVVDNARRPGRGRAVDNTGRRRGVSFTRLQGRTTVPIFILVPQVTLQKRLDIEAPAAKWARRLPGLVDRVRARCRLTRADRGQPEPNGTDARRRPYRTFGWCRRSCCRSGSNSRRTGAGT